MVYNVILLNWYTYTYLGRGTVHRMKRTLSAKLVFGGGGMELSHTIVPGTCSEEPQIIYEYELVLPISS